MTEREYRRHPRISYSSLKTFADSRMDYFKTYESGVPPDEEDETDSLRIGTIADCIAFEPEDFPNRFIVSTVGKPTGQMGQFVDKLFTLTRQSLSQDGVVTRAMEALLNDAYEAVAFNAQGERVAFKRKTRDQVIEEFSAGTGTEFYRQQRESLDKKLIEPGDEERAQRVVDKLKSHKLTRRIMTLTSGGKYKVYKQLKIFYKVRGVECKSMVDLLIVNTEDKIVQPFDLKTTYNPEFFDYNYLKYRYYIQAKMYDIAVYSWMCENGMEDFSLHPMKFIVADSNSQYDPLIFACSEKNLEEAALGFTANGRPYRGVYDLLDDLQWAKVNNIWSVSRENSVKGGICEIKTYE